MPEGKSPKRKRTVAKVLNAVVKRAARTAHEIDPIRTADQGVPEPTPYAETGFAYDPAPYRDRCGRTHGEVPNAGDPTP